MAKAAGAKVICTAGGEEVRKFGGRGRQLQDVAACVKDATADKGTDVWYEARPRSHRPRIA
jgi:hypothetical protein